MRIYYLLTQVIPLRIAQLTAPVLSGWRWVPVVVAWMIAPFFMRNATVANLWFNLGILAVLVVGFSWLSLWLPWEAIDRVVKYLGAPRRQRKLLRRFDKSWADYMCSVGLDRRSPTGDGTRNVPPLYGLEFNELGQLVAHPGLLLGQTVDDWEAACEQLRVNVGALRARVRPNRARLGLDLVFSFEDMLVDPIAVELPEPKGPVSYDVVPLGLDEDGRIWGLPLGVSTLTAGATGAGKGSVLWSFVINQGPRIALGDLQLWGIDLKGGMELSMGLPMFTRCATDPAEAVVMLEEAAKACRARAKEMAGRERKHTPSVESPTIAVLIDELADLVAYNGDRDLMRRAEAALAVLLTQGRAVGFYVYGFLQDPRKEVLKLRSLFPQAIALRLKEAEEGAMMLSSSAVRAGARCQDIPKSLPGVAYVYNELGDVTRVRAAYTSDDDLTEASKRFAAPVQIPIVVPEGEPETRSRRPRADRAEAA